MSVLVLIRHRGKGSAVAKLLLHGFLEGDVFNEKKKEQRERKNTANEPRVPSDAWHSSGASDAPRAQRVRCQCRCEAPPLA